MADGIFANRNSTADLLLVALIASAALAQRSRHLATTLLSSAAILATVDLALLVGLFLTGSRAGIALAPLALVAQFLILRRGDRRHGLAVAAGTACAAIVSAIYFTALRNTRDVAIIVERFTLEREFRIELWRDSVFALTQYWPIGAGQGTFVPVLIAAERLEVVDPTLPNRAHNDFLELAIEGGVPGLLALVLIGVIMFRATRATWETAVPDAKAQITFSLATLVILSLHSLVDYPLRSMALAGLVAAATGMFFPPAEARPGSSGSLTFEN